MKQLLTILFFLPLVCFGQITVTNATTPAVSTINATNSGASITLTQGRLYIFIAATTETTGAGSCSSPSFTWTASGSTGDATRRIEAFRCVPTSTVTELVTFTASDQYSGVGTVIYEITGAVTTGTNGGDGIVQTPSGGATGADPSISMSAISSGRNAVITAWLNDANVFGGTPETNWTEVTDLGFDTPTAGFYLMNRLATIDNTPAVTSASSTWIGLALELKAEGRRIYNIQ